MTGCVHREASESPLAAACSAIEAPNAEPDIISHGPAAAEEEEEEEDEEEDDSPDDKQGDPDRQAAAERKQRFPAIETNWNQIADGEYMWKWREEGF